MDVAGSRALFHETAQPRSLSSISKEPSGVSRAPPNQHGGSACSECIHSLRASWYLPSNTAFVFSRCQFLPRLAGSSLGGPLLFFRLPWPRPGKLRLGCFCGVKEDSISHQSGRKAQSRTACTHSRMQVSKTASKPQV